MLLGTQLTLMIGPTIPVPAPPGLMEALKQAEITHSDEGQSGFEIKFQVGRSGPSDLVDYSLLVNPLLKPMNRVILIVTINAIPHVLMDGFITQQQLSPSNQPGESTLSVTGEDVSMMMDMEEQSHEHPAQDETIIAYALIARYAQYGLIPKVIPPLMIDPPIPIERTPGQQQTDLQYLRDIAARHGYVFYVIPGPAPLTNTAYWGPPVRLGVPQRALSAGLGGETNVNSINFRINALQPTMVSGQVQDRLTNQTMPVETFASLRFPLAVFPVWMINQPNVRRTRFRRSGLNMMQSMAQAQAQTENSVDCVNADGELDTLRYGGLLEARTIVGLRGVGYSYDGLWYVKRVQHMIQKEKYVQNFTLVREGLGSTTPTVIP
jgi:hypothetical protein